MKKGKTLSLILLAALIGALIISGCAAPTPAPSPSPSPAPTSSPTPSPSPSQPAEVITWKMQSSFDPGNPEFVLATRVVAAVNEMSQGRFVIDLLPGGSVVPSAEELDGMRTAAIDATETSYGYHMTAIPAAALFNSRAGGLSAVQYAFWFRTGGGNELASEGLQPFGAMWIDFCIFPPEDWAYTTFPLNTLDDVKSLKMRTAGEGGEILTRMGASTVFMPGAEIYESMQRGVINAFEYGGSTSAEDMGFSEVFKYVYLSLSRAPADMAGFECRIDKWQALPDDLKQVLKRAIESEAWGYYDDELVKAAPVRETWRQKGIPVEPLPKVIEDAFLAEAQKFYEEKMQTADDFYKKVLQSQWDMEKLLEENGIF